MLIFFRKKLKQLLFRWPLGLQYKSLKSRFTFAQSIYSLSLISFPFMLDVCLTRHPMAVHSKINGPGPAVEPDPFEFFSFFNSPDRPPALRAVDDIFLAGKILPFGAHPPKRYQILEGGLRWRDALEVDHPTARCTADDILFTGKFLPFGDPPTVQPHLLDREFRAQALPNADRLRCFWGGANSKAGYRRLRKSSDCDGKRLVNTTSARPQKEPHRPRPRWFLFVLGSMRVPETMDMGNIRNRQRRRRSQAADPGGDLGRGPWRLLRSLSCRQLESATVVTAPPPLSFASRVKGPRSQG